MKLSDLDTIIDRRGSGCLKYDFAVQRGKPKDVLPFWVADMDFKVAKPILDALEKRVRHGIFASSASGEAKFKALTKPGDGILINQPVYYPFLNAVNKKGSKLVNHPMVLNNGQ